MKLLTHKDKNYEYTYYLDKTGNEVVHGEYKGYHTCGRMWRHLFFYHGKIHGEYKKWNMSGKLIKHDFHIDGDPRPYVEMNEHEKLLFQIKYPGFQFLSTS